MSEVGGRNVEPHVVRHYIGGMLTMRDFWLQGGMKGIEAAAARQAIDEQRRIWLPVLEAAVERGERFTDDEVRRAIRRLRRQLGLPRPDPSPEIVEQRRQKNRERVRRYREQQRRRQWS